MVLDVHMFHASETYIAFEPCPNSNNDTASPDISYPHDTIAPRVLISQVHVASYAIRMREYYIYMDASDLHPYRRGLI